MKNKYKFHYIVRCRGNNPEIITTSMINGTAPIIYKDTMSEAYVRYPMEPVMTITRDGAEFVLYELTTGLYIKRFDKYKDVIEYLKKEDNKKAIFEAMNSKGMFTRQDEMKEYIENNKIICDNFGAFDRSNILRESIEI